MADDDLVFRVQRLYTAIGAVEETDISKFIPKVINDGHRVGFYQDWSGGRSDAELANTVNLPKMCIARRPETTKVLGG